MTCLFFVCVPRAVWRLRQRVLCPALGFPADRVATALFQSHTIEFKRAMTDALYATMPLPFPVWTQGAPSVRPSSASTAMTVSSRTRVPCASSHTRTTASTRRSSRGTTRSRVCPLASVSFCLTGSTTGRRNLHARLSQLMRGSRLPMKRRTWSHRLRCYAEDPNSRLRSRWASPSWPSSSRARNGPRSCARTRSGWTSTPPFQRRNLL